MALPYPEGEVFFKRSVLKDNGHDLDPDNLTSFNSRALVEWCWNEGRSSMTYGRNRVCHMPGKHNKKDQYPYWHAMIVLFGSKEGFETSDYKQNSRHAGIYRMVKTYLPSTTDEYQKRAKGGPLFTAVTPIKLDPRPALHVHRPQCSNPRSLLSPGAETKHNVS